MAVERLVDLMAVLTVVFWALVITVVVLAIRYVATIAAGDRDFGLQRQLRADQ